MGYGGAERVILLLANRMVEQGIAVKIVVREDCARNYTINDAISVTALERSNKGRFHQALTRIIQFRTIVKQFSPDCVLSFVAELDSLPALMGLKTKLIVSERFDPAKWPTTPFKRCLRDFLYPRADGFVFQSYGAQAYFANFLKKKKQIIIANPLTPGLPYHVNIHGNSRLIAACRLTNSQKNLILMIDAVSDVITSGVECYLDIFGEGPDRAMLNDYIVCKGQQKNITLKGFSTNIHQEMANSAAFIISSNYEGVSNSMLEALAIGTPVIATDCPPGGARMFIKNGENGLLVPVGDRERLADAIKTVLTNPEYAEEMGQRATAIREQLDVNKITDQWMTFIHSVIDERQNNA